MTDRTIEPAVLSASDRYSRLFPAFTDGRRPDEVYRQLTRLAESMFDDANTMPHLLGKSIAAGYTYLGQFIAHDLTFDDTPFRCAGLVAPEKTPNYRTPFLDLDSVYGDGPRSHCHSGLYAANGVSFLIGQETNGRGAPFDVPLHHGRPMVADCRNCENAILRQLHAIFLLLHNEALMELPERMPAEDRFRAARQRVRWQYQWLVREKFLKAVCTTEVVESVQKDGCRIRYPQGQFSIPVEFSLAASRFGHSMVRESYILVPQGSGIDLLRLFATAHGKGPLPPDVVVNWRRFFRSEPSMRIDRRMVDPLGALKDESIDAFVRSPAPHGPRALPLRTLLRGAATKLPTGQQVRDRLDPQAIMAVPNSAYTVNPWDLLESLDFDQHTPLWYHILLEAELNETGRKLGPVGGRLLAEIIELSLRHDPESYLNHPDYHEGWRPPPWKNGTLTVTTPHHLAAVVGLEPRVP